MNSDPDIRPNAHVTASCRLPGAWPWPPSRVGPGIGGPTRRKPGLGLGAQSSLGNKADVWERPPTCLDRRPTRQCRGALPRVVRKRSEVRSHRPSLRGGETLARRRRWTSAGGHRAGASHTAASATPAVGVDAPFARAGVIACRTPKTSPRPPSCSRASRCRGVRGSASPATPAGSALAAHTASTHGLRVPELSVSTQKEVARYITGTVGTSNPVDAGAAVAAEDFAHIVERVLVSGEVDAVLVVLVATSLTDPAPVLRALSLLREKYRDTPILLVTHGVDARLSTLPAVTTFPSSGVALRALGHAAWYAAWLAERTAQTAADGDGSVDGTPLHVVLRRRVIADQLIATEANQEGWVGAAAAAELLGEYGLAPVGAVAAKPEAVADAGAGARVSRRHQGGRPRHHPSDRARPGPSRVGHDRGGPQRCRGLRPRARSARPPGAGAAHGRGYRAGSGSRPRPFVRTAGHGRCRWSGNGRPRRPDLHASPDPRGDVRRALRGLRCWPLLEGFRGAPRADVDALVELVLAVGRLVQDVPEVAELDLNPVVVSSNECSLVDVKLRLQRLESDPQSPRQLRPRPRALRVPPLPGPAQWRSTSDIGRGRGLGSRLAREISCQPMRRRICGCARPVKTS